MAMSTAMGNASERATPVPWRPILAVVASLAVCDVAMGLSYPLLSFLLAERGIGAGWIGANAAMTPLGLVLAAALVTPLARRFGAWRLAVAAAGGIGACLLLLKLLPGLGAWFVLRFLLGIALGVLFAITEAWIAALAPPAARGRIMGLYTSVLSLGFAIGPFLLPLTGTAGWPPFLAGLGAVLLGLLPLLALSTKTPPLAREGRGSFLAFARAAPTLLLAVGTFALLDTAVMALLPLYGLHHGLTEAAASVALGVLIVGNVALQPLVGWLADRWSWRTVLGGCALLTAAGGAALPAVIGGVGQWPLLFAWGAAGCGVYTVALAELGHRFTGAALVAGAAAFSAMWGIGGLLGAPLAGAAMELVGAEGLPLLLAGAFLPLVAAAARRGAR